VIEQRLLARSVELGSAFFQIIYSLLSTPFLPFEAGFRGRPLWFTGLRAIQEVIPVPLQTNHQNPLLRGCANNLVAVSVHLDVGAFAEAIRISQRQRDQRAYALDSPGKRATFFLEPRAQEHRPEHAPSRRGHKLRFPPCSRTCL